MNWIVLVRGTAPDSVEACDDDHVGNIATRRSRVK